MKKIILFLLLFISWQVRAQDSKIQAEAAVIAQRDDKLILILSSDNLKGLPGNIDAKAIRSRGFSFILMTEKMNKTGNAGIGGGIGFMSQNFHTNSFIADTTSNESYTSFQKIPDSLNYSINKFSLNFITATIEIRLRSNENKNGNRFKLSAGVTGGFLLQSHTKYSDNNGKFKTYDIDHLNKFQYGICARLGYSNYNIAGYYSLVDVFKKGDGVEVTPFSIGIALTF